MVTTSAARGPARLNRLMQQMGIDANGGNKISSQDAGKILNHLDSLPALEQQSLKSELTQALQSDAFEFDNSARTAFAQAFGVQVEELSPKQKANLGAGVTQAVGQIAFDRLAKGVNVKRSDMTNFLGLVKESVPPFFQNILAESMQNAASSGAIKFDAGARKDFVAFKAQAASAPGIEDAKEFLGLNKTREESYLSTLLASGASFEDIVSAFLASVAGKQKKEQMALMREIEANEKQLSRRNNLKQQADSLRNGGGASSKPAAPTAKNANAVINDLLGDTSTAKTPDAPAAAGAPQEDFGATLKKTKSALTNLTNTVEKHSSDDVITWHESKAIAGRLDALPKNVDKLIAGSLKNAIVHSELALSIGKPGKQGQSNLKPILEWVEGKLGKQNWDPVYSSRDVKTADGSGVMKQEYLHKRGASMTGDLAKKLFKKGDEPGEFRLENKISAFIVDSLFMKDSGKKSNIDKLDTITAKLSSQNEAMGAKAVESAPKPSLEGVQEIPQKTKMMAPTPGSTLGDNIDAALEKAEESKSPVTLHFAEEPVVVMPGASKEAVLSDFAQRTGIQNPENTLVAQKGTSLEEEVVNAVALANKTGTPATLFFNNEKVTVPPGANAQEVINATGDRFGWGTEANTMASVGAPSVMTLDEIEKELASTPEPKSRELMFEKLKQANQKMSEFMQLMSSISNAFKTVIDAIIRGIR